MKHIKWWIVFLSFLLFIICLVLFPFVTLYAIWADNEEFGFRIFLTNIWVGFISFIAFQLTDA